MAKIRIFFIPQKFSNPQKITYSKPDELLADGFKYAGQLVGAGCGTFAAGDAPQTPDGFIHFHSLDERSYAFPVSVAAAGEYDFPYGVSFEFDVDLI